MLLSGNAAKKPKEKGIQMELIMISSTKLKIMLSAEDMKKLDFDPKLCTDISGREAFRNILKEARDRCGFDAIGDRVFVQYYPEKHGGCEMFVTKLEDAAGGEQRTKRKRQTTNLFSAKADHPDTDYIIYSFPTIDGLLSTCRSLRAGGYRGSSAAYGITEKRRSYYLVLDKDSFLASENGGALCRGAFYYVLREHGRLICGDAVAKLGELS